MSAKPSAAAECDFPTPGGPRTSRLAPFSSQASPAASAWTWAFEIIGAASKGEAALTSVGELLLGERGNKARGGRAFLGERAPDELRAGEARFGKKKIDACGVDFVVRLHAVAPSREASGS